VDDARDGAECERDATGGEHGDQPGIQGAVHAGERGVGEATVPLRANDNHA